MSDPLNTGEPSPNAGGSSSSLPSEIIESIAISNAKSIGEQPAILANLALANQILNNNLQQQFALSYQQSMSQVAMATVSKCISMITSGSASDMDPKEFEDMMKLVKTFIDGKGDANAANNAPPAP